MNTRNNYGMVARVARRSMVLVSLLLMMLTLTGSSVAQSSAVTKPADAKAAPAAGPTKLSAAPLAPRAPKGTGEGIRVYGQWTIEVRNRDGSVAKHVEFENSLLQTGEAALALLLSGNAVPGGWMLAVQGDPSPCSSNSSDEFYDTCIMVPAGTGWVYYLGSLFTNICTATVGVASPQPYCYETLGYSLTPIIGAPSIGAGTVPLGLVLSGQAYVDTTTNITSVSTTLILCGSYAPTWTGSTNTNAPSGCFLSATNGQTVFALPGFSSYSFGQTGSCGGSGQPLCPVYVQAGQTISASVQYTFSSASSSSSSSDAAKANASPLKVMQLKRPTSTPPTTK